MVVPRSRLAGRARILRDRTLRGAQPPPQRYRAALWRSCVSRLHLQCSLRAARPGPKRGNSTGRDHAEADSHERPEADLDGRGPRLQQASAAGTGAQRRIAVCRCGAGICGAKRRPRAACRVERPPSAKRPFARDCRPGAAMIVVEQIRKSFNGTRALDGFTLHVGAGELFGLVGPNGAGKTTLMKTLSTLLPIDSGTAQIGGLSVPASSAWPRTFDSHPGLCWRSGCKQKYWGP